MTKRFVLTFLVSASFLACNADYSAQDRGINRARLADARPASGQKECYGLIEKKTQKKLGLLDLKANGDLVSGDIVYGRIEQDKPGFQLGFGIIRNFPGMGEPWPNGRVPYAVENSSAAFASGVENQIQQLETKLDGTIEFVKRTNETNYIAVVPISGNLSTSNVGMVGGRQELRLSTNYTPAVLWHELLHALGMWHEQMRQDRDDFITLIDANIPENLKLQYDTLFADPVGAFDTNSIMLYDSCGGYSQFGCSSPHFTLENGSQHRAAQDVSSGDIATIKYLYADDEITPSIDLLPPQYKLKGSNNAPFVLKALPEDTTLTAVTYNLNVGSWTAYDNPAVSNFAFGGEGHVPVPGNYYGDDAAEAAFFYPAKRKWFYQEEFAEWPTSDVDGPLIPVAFDYDNNGFVEPAVFSRGDGKWYIKGQADSVEWNIDKDTDTPVPARYGSERGNIAIFTAETASYHFHKNDETIKIALAAGSPVPIAADYDGDEIADPGVYDYDTGKWWYQSSKTGDIMMADTGKAQKLPFAADWNLDGSIETRFHSAGGTYEDVDLVGTAEKVEVPQVTVSDDDANEDENDEDDDDDSGLFTDKSYSKSSDDDDDDDTEITAVDCD